MTPPNKPLPFSHRHPFIYLVLSAIPAMVLAGLLLWAYHNDKKHGREITIPTDALMHLAG